jgi:hypothetical protein
MNDKNSTVLVFSLGLNSYDRMYQQCIESQREYAARFGYDYRLINKPQKTSITASAWLKIPLLIRALEQNYEWVAYIDADCEIKAKTPAIVNLAVKGKSLYMANGFSGRINSGVIIVKNTAAVKVLLQTIYQHCTENVPEADWGENGHIIHFASQWEGLQILDSRWNNNANPELDDYIRHYSAGGPMRALYPATFSEKMARFLQNLKNRINRKKYLPRNETFVAVEQLFNQVIGLNPF